MTAPNYAELVGRLRKFGEPVCRFKGDDPVEYACEGGTCKCYELTVQEVYSAADAILALQREIDEATGACKALAEQKGLLRAEIARIKPYLRHDNDCDYETGGFCDCGLGPDSAMQGEQQK